MDCVSLISLLPTDWSPNCLALALRTLPLPLNPQPTGSVSRQFQLTSTFFYPMNLPVSGKMKEDFTMTHKYKNVPDNGKFFVENGKTYYWNNSNVKPGTQYKTKNKAWVSTGSMVTQVADEPTQLSCFGPNSTPVLPMMIENPGFFYEIDSWTTAVENRVIDGCHFTKWCTEYPLSSATQQALAWNSQSNEEYEAKKQAALAAD